MQPPQLKSYLQPPQSCWQPAKGQSHEWRKAGWSAGGAGWWPQQAS